MKKPLLFGIIVGLFLVACTTKPAVMEPVTNQVPAPGSEGVDEMIVVNEMPVPGSNVEESIVTNTMPALDSGVDEMIVVNSTTNLTGEELAAR